MSVKTEQLNFVYDQYGLMIISEGSSLHGQRTAATALQRLLLVATYQQAQRTRDDSSQSKMTIVFRKLINLERLLFYCYILKSGCYIK